MTPPTVDEQEILLADLDTELLLRIVELADPLALRVRAERELPRMRSSEFNDFEPCDLVGAGLRIGRCAFVMRGNHFGCVLEAALESLDEDGSEWAGSEIRGKRLMAIKDISI